MIKKYLFFGIVFFLIVTSCENSSSEDRNTKVSESEKMETDLQKEIISIHDEVMPKMGELNKMTRGLKNTLEKSNDLNPKMKERFNKAIENLEKADEAMMDWMAGYSAAIEGLKEKSQKEKMGILNKEKEKIIEVKNLMLSSMKEGETLLNPQ